MSFPSETLQCDLVGLPVPRQILCQSKSQAVFRLMQQGEVANFGDSSIINNLETILFASMKLIICYIPHFVMLILACYN